MTKTKDLTPEQRSYHDAVLDLSDIWAHCVDRCIPGREQEIDDAFEELGKLRLENQAFIDGISIESPWRRPKQRKETTSNGN